MRADRQSRSGPYPGRHAVFALALLSSLVECSKEPPPAAASSGNQSPSAPSTQAAGASPEPTPPIVMQENRTQPPQPTPDEALAAKVKSNFAEAGLPALAVDVASSNGAVTLYGTVDSSQLRDRVGRLASSVEGVRSVANQLLIVRGS